MGTTGHVSNPHSCSRANHVYCGGGRTGNPFTQVPSIQPSPRTKSLSRSLLATKRNRPVAQMRIYATGRFPPNANVVVSDLVSKKVDETPRTKTFDVTGTRTALLVGTTDGWLFYGWAPE